MTRRMTEPDGPTYFVRRRLLLIKRNRAGSLTSPPKQHCDSAILLPLSAFRTVEGMLAIPDTLQPRLAKA